MNTIDLEKIFLKLQEQMITKLSADREIISHPGTKGDASELNWLDMLKTYIPTRYKVDKAFVLDSDGTISDQIDIVVYDRHYSPFLFHQDGTIYIPAESVYAVFEVKQTINKNLIEYAGKKAESVRKLKRTSIRIPHAGGEYKPKKPFRIISGILSLDSEWTIPLGNSLKKALSNLNKRQRLDLGCVLQCGGFEVKYGKVISIKKSEPHEALIFFFLRLLHRLQNLGTIPAMNISKYGKALE
jgi:hypothetical protein